MIKRFFVNLRRDGGMLKNRLDFRSKDKPAILVIEIKRLYAGAIAGEHEPLLFGIPQRDAVIAFQVVNKIQPAFFVEMQNCFRVSTRAVNMATLFQSFAQPGVIINFAVENEPRAISAAMHGLMTRGGKIYDREAAEAK